MDNFYVYAYFRAKSSINGPSNSPYYIGKGCGNRAFVGHGNVPLPKDRSRIVVIREGLSEEEAHLEERRLIMVYGRIDKGTGCLRNRTDGGEGFFGGKHSEEYKQILRQNMTGKRLRLGLPITEETKEKLRQCFAGKKQSAEHIEKRRQANLGKKRTPEQNEANRQRRLGTKLSAETIAKMHSPENIAKRTGLKRSPEARANIGAAGRGRIRSQETRAKTSASLRATWAKRKAQAC